MNTTLDIKAINEFVNRSLNVEDRVIITRDKDEYEVHKESGAYLLIILLVEMRMMRDTLETW